MSSREGLPGVRGSERSDSGGGNWRGPPDASDGGDGLGVGEALSGCWVSSVVSRVGAEGWSSRCLGQAAVGRPTISFQVVNRVVISCRYWIAVSR
jgi:hypothetical protein